ncbi:Hsp20/alpha crystallin family protein [Ramlibacter sp. AW1]|uniref:Hsp20/alpha crystallin family protein n=1 Tax=Ramlibacter aurantiacus TaxID=2801330 RepID=A0A936ZJS5_9BURK|nr:Hsp20/alpha crystallin family protein [Ramlibacter aurantiacus]MBL0421097.1 Hsp20/alpha crystallin family protein [Ramlibacter aurantiacus]
MMSRFLVPFSSSRALGDPFSELHREMNRLLDDFVGGSSPGAAQGAMGMPRMDVRESEQEISVCAELPGVRPADVDLRIEGNVITIRGEKKNEATDRKEDYHVMERSWGRFQRSLQLPFAPDPDQVRADFEHGVLTIRVPKQPQQDRSRRIDIQGADKAQRHEDAKVLDAPSGRGDAQPSGGAGAQDTSQATPRHH